MKKSIDQINRILLLVLTMTLINSCKEDFNDGLGPMRMFSPGEIKTTSTASSVTIEWDRPLHSSDKSLEYVIQISRDRTFANQEGILEFKINDEREIVLTDEQLEVRRNYYARIMTLAVEGAPESNWRVSNSFSILGTQNLAPFYAPEIRPKSAILRVISDQTGLTKVVFQPMKRPLEGANPVEDDEAEVIEVDITDQADDILNNKMIRVGNVLTPETMYNVDVYRGNLSVGYATIVTPKEPEYTTVLNPGDDLAAYVAASASGDIIGLNPGEYDTNTINVSGKTISIVSVSHDPLDTKVAFKEFNVLGEGAGVELHGIYFDGLPKTSNYLFNLPAGSAKFTKFIVRNCIVKDVNTAVFRTRAGAVGDHAMDSLNISYSLFENIGTLHNFTIFHLDRMEFKGMEIKNSTFNGAGRALILYSQAMAPPVTPEINIDQCTFNNFGANRDNIIVDAGSANVINFKLTNSIVANIPKPGSTVNGSYLRAITPSVVAIENNNFFNTSNGEGEALTFPTHESLAVRNHLNHNLGWSSTTTDFSLPTDQSHAVRISSTSGRYLGDPRWIY